MDPYDICAPWDITQRIVVIPYWCFGTTYRPIFEGQEWKQGTLKVEMIGCAETLAGNYHHTLRYIPEERRSHLLCSGRHKSRMVFDVFRDHSAISFKNQGVQE